MVFLLICGSTAFAQSRNNHWLLGSTDVNFSTNPPVANVVAGGGYGYATISDSSGALLFYTDGLTVWNKNHQIMQNGSSLDYGYSGGDTTSPWQRVIIVPHPGNSNKYYIFRNRLRCYSGGGTNGWCNGTYVYSIVDFSSNSLGMVLPANSPTSDESTYSLLLRYSNGDYLEHEDGDLSPLTFTTDSSGSNYWVIVKNYGDLLSFKVDSQGLNTEPVVSTFTMDTGYYSAMFRIAPLFGAAKLYGLEFQNSFYSVDFDMDTGQFTNYQNILLEDGIGYYNFELSPDFSKAYFVVTGSKIVVKDLTNPSLAVRTLCEFANPTVVPTGFRYLQKDKYGNMLVSGDTTDLIRNKYLHIIDNPNSFSNSTIKINSLYLNGNTIRDLPQLCPKVECIESLYLNTTETASKTYKVSNIISTNTNYIVNSGVTITLKAENAIFLEPNTDIKNGSVLYAEIEVCSNSSTDRVGNHSQDVSSSDEILDNTFIMYPNPTDNVTTFTMADDVIKNLTIYSLDGRIVFSKDIMQKEYSVDVKDYPKGIYIVTVATLKGETITKKLVKN